MGVLLAFGITLAILIGGISILKKIITDENEGCFVIGFLFLFHLLLLIGLCRSCINDDRSPSSYDYYDDARK